MNISQQNFKILTIVSYSLFFLVGCSYSHRLKKASDNMEEYRQVFPVLFDTKTDTNYIRYNDTILIGSISYDTTFNSSADTIKIGNDTIQTTIYIDRLKTTTKYRVITDVKAHTVIKIKYRTIIKIKEIQKDAPSNDWLIYFRLAVMFLGIIVIAFGINKLRK